MDQERIRKRAKLLKATQNVSYKELAEYLEISTSTMYNWLHCQFDFSEHRALCVATLYNKLKDPSKLTLEEVRNLKLTLNLSDEQLLAII